MLTRAWRDLKKANFAPAMSKILNVAVMQSDIVWEDCRPNLVAVVECLKRQPHADLLVLPEMFNTGFTNNVAACAQPLDGAVVAELQHAVNQSVTAICGSMISVVDGLFYNTMFFLSPAAAPVFYHKRHLFAYGGEGDVFSAGQRRVVLPFAGWRIALFVCYDLRFPVWCRNVDDYDIAIFVANWPQSRRHAFDTLLSARAIENLCYVVACNRIGIDGNDIQYNGGSQVVDYQGVTVAAAHDDCSEVIAASLDYNRLHEFRHKFPALNDRDEFTL